MNPPSPDYRRVTMSDVALAAHVHKSTVSLALRNQPKLNAATRERIRKIAEELGYRPDPMLDLFNLIAVRWPPRPAGAIAFVSDLPNAAAFARRNGTRDLRGGPGGSETAGFHAGAVLGGTGSAFAGAPSQVLLARGTPEFCLARSHPPRDRSTSTGAGSASSGSSRCRWSHVWTTFPRTIARPPGSPSYSSGNGAAGMSVSSLQTTWALRSKVS